MSPLDRKSLKNVRSESSSMQIGKSGLSESLIDELNLKLKKDGLIKVKFLKNSPYKTRKEAFSALTDNLDNNIKLLETRGWTAILQKKD